MKAFSMKAFSMKAFAMKAFSMKAFAITAFAIKAFAIKAFAIKPFSIKSFSIKAFSIKAFSIKAFSIKAIQAESTIHFKVFNLFLIFLNRERLNRKMFDKPKMSPKNAPWFQGFKNFVSLSLILLQCKLGGLCGVRFSGWANALG
jgi:hypothetical protein